MLKCGVIVAAVLAWTGTDGAIAEPYSFQNNPLGIDLEQFRELKPATTTSVVSGETMENTRAFCSGDELPSLDVDVTITRQDALNAKAGERICQFFGQKNGDTSTWRLLANEFGNTHGWAIFRFIDDPGDHRYRLFRIDLVAENNNYLDVFMAYTAKYKKPAQAETREVQNALGQSLGNHTVTWTNGESSVTLTQRAGRMDYMSVEYVLHRLEKHFAKKLAETRKTGADTL